MRRFVAFYVNVGNSACCGISRFSSFVVLRKEALSLVIVLFALELVLGVWGLDTPIALMGDFYTKRNHLNIN